MSKDNILILGFGGGSIKILNYIYQKEPELNILCVDQDVEALSLSEAKTLQFDGFDSLYNAIKNAEEIAVILALGGHFGTYIAEYILEYLLNKNLNISVIATTPFRFEGKQRFFNARSTLDTIQDMVFDTIWLNNDKLIENLNKQLTLTEAYKVIDESVYNILKTKFL